MDEAPPHRRRDDDEFATRAELGALRDRVDRIDSRVDELHAGLLGTIDLPGGRLGEIARQLTHLPETIKAEVLDIIAQRERQAHEAKITSRRAFLWDVVKVIVASAAVIGAAVITVKGW